jgi:hypothetical protein
MVTACLNARSGSAVLFFLFHQVQLQAVVLILGAGQFGLEGFVAAQQILVLLYQVADQLFQLAEGCF